MSVNMKTLWDQIAERHYQLASSPLVSHWILDSVLQEISTGESE